MVAIEKKHAMRLFRIILFFTVLIGLGACQEDLREDQISEGIVEYNITYLENKMSKAIPTNLLPGKVILKIKDDKSVMEIDGFMGLFSLRIITDHRRGVSTSMLQVIDKKLYHEGSSKDGMYLFKGFPGMEIELRAGKKEVAGMNCRRGRVIIPGEEEETFPFYYTDDIVIRNPNIGNPYEDVEGVLMQFQMNLNKLRMNLIASRVKDQEISDDEFIVPDEYLKVSRHDLEDILNTLMD